MGRDQTLNRYYSAIETTTKTLRDRSPVTNVGKPSINEVKCDRSDFVGLVEHRLV